MKSPSIAVQFVSGIAGAALLLAALAITPTQLSAQTEATISGVLTDSSGAGVPTAGLTLINQETAAALVTVKSDGGGKFDFPVVPAPAIYTLSIEAAGFARLKQKNVVLALRLNFQS